MVNHGWIPSDQLSQLKNYKPGNLFVNYDSEKEDAAIRIEDIFTGTVYRTKNEDVDFEDYPDEEYLF